MKLSVNIIYSALKEAFPDAVLRRKSRDDDLLVLHPPRWNPGPFRFEAAHCHVAVPERIPADFSAEGRCLLVTTEPLHGLSHKNISVIAVPGADAGADAAALYNRLLTIFDRYADWDDTLKELVFQNAPIEEYLKASFPILGNCLSVHDNNFNYLARCGEPPAQDAPLHRRDFFDPDFLLRVDRRSSQSVFYSKEVIYYQEDYAHLEYLFLNLFNGNTAAGRLVVVSGFRPFEPQDASLARHLGKYLEAALSYAAFTGTGKNLRRDSLLEYLSGKEHSDNKIMHLKTVSPFSKLKADQRLYCLACICQDSEVTEQYIAFQLERAFPDSVCVLFDSRIVLLCANQPKQAAASLFAALEKLLKQYALVAGCSNPFTDFFDLKYCYQEAIFALQQAAGAQDGRLLIHFKEHMLGHFLQYGCSVLPARLICADCVMKLAEHDADAAVSYCDSLRIYLDTGMNATETARRLGIQRNTFLARLERILRFVDLDLEDGDNRLHLQISLRLIRKRPARNLLQ